MKQKWKEWAASHGMEKWFQRDNLIILILSGVLLFIIALPTNDGTGGGAGENGLTPFISGEQDAESGDGSGTEASRVGTVDAYKEAAMEGEDYATYLEQRLEKIISGMDGAGNVKVMVTLKSSQELVVEKDTGASRSGTTENDGEGGSRIVNQVENQETTIYSTRGSDADPYVIKTLVPQVEGVVVVAQGAGSGTINKNITEVVQALFDIEAHKVKVVKGGQ